MNDNPISINYLDNIAQSGLSIYDPIEIGDPRLWIPAPELETLLNKTLSGISLAGLPLRTRSKAVIRHLQGTRLPCAYYFPKNTAAFPRSNV